MATHNATSLTEEQMQVLNITLEVLKPLVMSIGMANPPAFPKVGALLRAAVASGAPSPMASQMLDQLAEGVEVLSGARKPS